MNARQRRSQRRAMRGLPKFTFIPDRSERDRSIRSFLTDWIKAINDADEKFVPEVKTSGMNAAALREENYLKAADQLEELLGRDTVMTEISAAPAGEKAPGGWGGNLPFKVTFTYGPIKA